MTTARFMIPATRTATPFGKAAFIAWFLFAALLESALGGLLVEQRVFEVLL